MKLNEVQTQGPLDIARNLQAEALRLGSFAQAHLERNPHDLADLANKVHQLDYAHPWMGQEISIYGIQLTVSMDNDVAIPYCLPPDSRRNNTRGVYNGMTIRHVYDAETDEQQYKVVYMLHNDTIGPLLDPFGNTHKTDRYNYVCLQGSEGSPALPEDAHSLRDLADDPVVAEIDNIVLDEQDDPLLKIARLGEVVNEGLALEEVEFEPIDLNHQRASYLNSLGLHYQVQLVVNDLIIGDADEIPANYLYSSLESHLTFEPYFFTIAPGYDRLTGHDEPLAGGPPELYAHVETEDGQIVLAPLKSILDVRELQSH
ncbi:MAG TPA: hypothetical protein VFH99_00575 [Candidatus Saccharimonadales bacterium]|nr:hypothetical protein [Candidatus Saccharimonadales bacterium]